jgi:pyridoxamine 5'-phosphate oxidase
VAENRCYLLFLTCYSILVTYSFLSQFMADYLAPWRSHIARALHLNRAKPDSRYVQLATISSERLPTNRTIVFRGFLAKTDRLQFISDTRSDKFNHLQQQPWGEICWYFTKTREQFRLAGTFTLITFQSHDSELLTARQIMWQNLSDAARIQFTWANPGEMRQNTPEMLSCDPPSSIQPLDTFCLLLLTPQKVDRLQLKGNPQNRYFYTLRSDSTWEVKEVNP